MPIIALVRWFQETVEDLIGTVEDMVMSDCDICSLGAFYIFCTYLLSLSSRLCIYNPRDIVLITIRVRLLSTVYEHMT